MAPWMDNKMVKWNGAKNFWDFWNGSKIWLCHCQYEKDLIKYQGSEIGALCKAVETEILMADGSMGDRQFIRRPADALQARGGLEGTQGIQRGEAATGHTIDYLTHQVRKDRLRQP